MLPVEFVMLMLVLHYIGDFFLQSHWMAANKSSDSLALSAHVGTYMAVLFLGIYFLSPSAFLHVDVIAVFVLINGLLHFLIDFITSRITARFWKKQEWHWFFCVIGFDQLLHVSCLLLTGYYGVSQILLQYFVHAG